MRFLDLFSGIGGFSLGLERAGHRTVAFCEIEPFCRALLKERWPAVPCYDDVRNLTAERLVSDGIGIDAICGGFPCQDISLAGKGAGIEGSRSGLWSEYARIVGELRPRYVIVENVSALLGRGLDKVLGDLAALGYDAEWHCIPASAIGAPHRRDRLWIVAYPCSSEWRKISGARQRLAWSECLSQWQEGSGGFEPGCEDVADAGGRRCNRDRPHISTEGQPKGGIGLEGGGNCQPIELPHTAHNTKISARIGWGESAREWRTEPNVGRVAHGVPARVDRLKALGNAVVPQIPELIGKAILDAND